MPKDYTRIDPRDVDYIPPDLDDTIEDLIALQSSHDKALAERDEAKADLDTLAAIGRNQISELEARVKELEGENAALRQILADANNVWRHDFEVDVAAAANKLYKKLSWYHTVRPAIESAALKEKPGQSK